jgi:hypothetical protein
MFVLALTAAIFVVVAGLLVHSAVKFRGRPIDALRLTQDQLIRQVIQGGGNMPAYGKNLSPPETTALVAFLETLHPAGQAPARNFALGQ